MKQIKKLGQEDFEQVFQIMKRSFPADERREKDRQKALFHNPAYNLYGYEEEGELLAFLSLYRFEGVQFVEHFAVTEACRNKGIGKWMLQEILDQESCTVLEVELPESDLTKRRIGFYQRNGLKLNDFDYIQPPMRENGTAIPLKIMSYPEKLNVEQYEKIRDLLYRKVYGTLTFYSR